MEVKIQKLQRLKIEPWTLTREARRLEREPWKVYGPVEANSHHFDEEQDPDPDTH